MIFMIVLMVLPLILLFSYGFLEVDGNDVAGGFTFDTYAALLTNGYFWTLFSRTFFIAVSVTIFSLVLGYPIAWLSSRCRGWKRTALLLIVATPLLTSALVRTFAWIVILGKQGVVNGGLLALGLVDAPISLLFDSTAVVIGMTQVMLPFMVIPLISAIQNVPDDTQDAARNLGSGFFRTFWTVMVPQTVPGIAAGITLVFALSYSEFTVAVLLGGGSFNFASIYIYEAMTTLLDWGRGAAAASILLLSSLVTITLLNIGTRRLTRWSRATQ